MAVYTMTLAEVLDLPNFNLFEEHHILAYDRLKKVITDAFYEREIAFETPQYFKRKLNHYLEVRADNYNKMLKAQLIEIDPFMTEYLETFDEEHSESKKKQHNKANTIRDIDNNTVEKHDKSENEVYDGTGTAVHEQENVGVAVKGTLFSEAINVTDDAEKQGSKTSTEGITYREDKDTTISRTEDTTFNETKDGTLDKNVKTTYNEEKDKSIDETKDSTKQVNKSHNQTGRNWTENGSTEGHTLDVHSDTPQAMLFNEPNHYYGTGRAHDYGKVVTGADGNQSYEHYPETEPSQIDRGSYQIGGGDTPWFNYASTADNHTGHDSYSKQGTETFQQSDTESSTDKDVTNRSENEVTDSNKNEDTSETTHEETESTKNVAISETDNVDTVGSKDTSYSETTTSTEHSDHSSTKNTDENVKEDKKENESFDEQTTAKHTKDNTFASTSSRENAVKESEGSVEHGGEKMRTHTDARALRRGRTMRSPSKLLDEYRETLMYNADMWLLGELKPLFLALY